MKRILVVAALVSLGATAASAQQGVTVKSLLVQDFAVVGAITSSAGPGVFLQKKDKLFLCFVAETPSSTAVATRYCKPVE
jgi:hypothetical protein